jgi:hypothetical protein
MTFVGKLLVLLYGTASLFCLIAAIAIYTQKMNFVTPKGEDARKVPPLVDKSIAKTKQLLQANNRAFTRWVQNYEEVGRLEVEEYRRREFYSRQIELALTGQVDGKGVKEPPIQEIKFDEAALKESPPSRIVQLDVPQRTAELTKPGGTPLKPPFVYINGIKKANEDVVNLQEQSLKLLADESKITRTINGSDQPPPFKGLRTRIKEQEHIGEIADNERLFLEDIINTRRIDEGIFARRRDEMKSRIERLKEFDKKKQLAPAKAGGQG